MLRVPLLSLILALGCSLSMAWAQKAGDQLLRTTQVVQLHLKMTEKQYAELQPALPKGPFAPGVGGFGPKAPVPENAHRNTFGIDFPWSQADLDYAGTTFKNVGIRYKGNYTYLIVKNFPNKSFKIDLNRHVDGQKLDGLTMLNLHNGATDSSRIRETLSYAICRDLGIPASRTCYAEVYLSVTGQQARELIGLYTVVEQVNKGFLKKHFQDGSGLLLKPEGLQGGIQYLGAQWKPYEDRYKPEHAATEEQQQKLLQFARLVSTGSDDQFAREIEQHLDVDSFLRFITMNVLLANMDSYLGFGHNYYLYLSPKSNQFVFIPWDMDLSLATWPAAGTPEQLVDLSIHHPHMGANRLIDRLFAIEKHKQRYLELLREATAGTFERKRLYQQIEELEKAITDPLTRARQAQGKQADAKAMMVAFGGLLPPRRFVDQRLESIASQLAGKSNGFEPKGFGPPGFGPPGFGPPGFGPPGKGVTPPKKGM